MRGTQISQWKSSYLALRGVQTVVFAAVHKWWFLLFSFRQLLQRTSKSASNFAVEIDGACTFWSNQTRKQLTDELASWLRMNAQYWTCNLWILVILSMAGLTSLDSSPWTSWPSWKRTRQALAQNPDLSSPFCLAAFSNMLFMKFLSFTVCLY